MKNIIIKTTAYIAAAIFIISVCLLNSETQIPAITASASGAWLALLAYANGILRFDY